MASSGGRGFHASYSAFWHRFIFCILVPPPHVEAPPSFCILAPPPHVEAPPTRTNHGAWRKIAYVANWLMAQNGLWRQMSFGTKWLMAHNGSWRKMACSPNGLWRKKAYRAKRLAAPPPHVEAPPIRTSHAPFKCRPRLLCI